MKRWGVCFEVDASVYVEVEAETEEGARMTAWEVVDCPVLCHHCTNELEVGDVREISFVDELDEGENE